MGPTFFKCFLFLVLITAGNAIAYVPSGHHFVFTLTVEPSDFTLTLIGMCMVLGHSLPGIERQSQRSRSDFKSQGHRSKLHFFLFPRESVPSPEERLARFCRFCTERRTMRVINAQTEMLRQNMRKAPFTLEIYL